MPIRAFSTISQSTRDAVEVLDAIGKEYVIIGIFGVGRDEVDVAKSAHTTVIIIMPGMGDDIQAIKAGIFEVGDIIAINDMFLLCGLAYQIGCSNRDGTLFIPIFATFLHPYRQWVSKSKTPMEKACD